MKSSYAANLEMEGKTKSILSLKQKKIINVNLKICLDNQKRNLILKMAWAFGESKIGVERAAEFRLSARSNIAKERMAAEIATWPASLLNAVIVRYLRRLEEAGVSIENL